ncbi:MAG: NUDIX hydrolase [Cyanobacteria bacterium TGS_CYA1]|nr:NUDIX hydrolase [Cyanobacteria bacterium TGS_CYA1]
MTNSGHKGKKPPVKHEGLAPTVRVSALVLGGSMKEPQVLLVRHRRKGANYWALPGGRLHHGESFQECALRELKEETGLEGSTGPFLFFSEALSPNRSKHIIHICIICKVKGGKMQLGDEPVLAGVAYVSLDELMRLNLYPPVQKQILDYSRNHYNSNQSINIQYLGNLWL